MNQLQFKTLIAKTLLDQEYVINIEEQIELLKEVIDDIEEEGERQLQGSGFQRRESNSMKDFLINIGLFLGILETDQCTKCYEDLMEHGFYGERDCMNSKCDNYRYKGMKEYLDKKRNKKKS
jgi:hypothetical protein